MAGRGQRSARPDYDTLAERYAANRCVHPEVLAGPVKIADLAR